MTCTIFQTAVIIVHHYHVQQNYLLFNYFFAVILWCYFDLAYVHVRMAHVRSLWYRYFQNSKCHPLDPSKESSYIDSKQTYIQWQKKLREPLKMSASLALIFKR